MNTNIKISERELKQIEDISSMKKDIKYIKKFIVKNEQKEKESDKKIDIILDEIRGLKRNTSGISKRVMSLETREKKMNTKIKKMYKIYEIIGWFLTTDIGKFTLIIILTGLSSIYLGKDSIKTFIGDIVSNL